MGFKKDVQQFSNYQLFASLGFKDVNANSFCASLLRTPRHASSAR